MLHRIIYTSAANPDLKVDDYREIALKASEGNKRKNITGMLLFCEGGVLQILEGKKPVIESLFEAIKYDKRHNNVMKLIDRPCTSREFPTWSMGFRNISNLNDLDFVFALRNNTLKDRLPDGQRSETHVLTDTFSKIHRLNVAS